MGQSPMLTQVTPQAKIFNQETAPPPPLSMPQKSPMTMMGQEFLQSASPAPTPTAAPAPANLHMSRQEPAKVKSEAELIVNALVKRLNQLPGPADQGQTPAAPTGMASPGSQIIGM